VNIIVNLNFKF
jgi:coiled-coil domain-containing protein 39